MLCLKNFHYFFKISTHSGRNFYDSKEQCISETIKTDISCFLLTLHQYHLLYLVSYESVAEPINMSTPQMNYVNEEQPKQYEGTKAR